MPKYRVLYAVTRGEFCEIEAITETEAQDNAFSEGLLDESSGDTTDVNFCECEEIAEFTPVSTSYAQKVLQDALENALRDIGDAIRNYGFPSAREQLEGAEKDMRAAITNAKGE